MTDVHPDSLEQMKKTGTPTTRWAAYQNHDLSSPNCGDLRFLAVGEGHTFKEPPERYPDSQHGLGRRYLLTGWVNLETGMVEERSDT